MNTLLTLSGDSRPAAEPAIGAATAVGAVSPVADEATQLAQDFASALAALSGGELARSAPAAAAQSDPSGDQLQADLRDLLRALEQGMPAGQSMATTPAVATPGEPEPTEQTDAAQETDMPAMDGLLQLLQPQLAAQMPNAPVAALTVADKALPSSRLPERGVAASATEWARGSLPAPPPAPVEPVAVPVALPAPVGDDTSMAAVIKPTDVRPAATVARAEPAFGTAVLQLAKTDSDAGDGLAAIDGSGPVAALSGPSAQPQIKTPAPLAPTVLHLPDAQPRQWQQPLMQALGDRLQLQIAARSEQAVIRLEPPLLGRVEISIQHQAGDLQVRLSASHPEVTRQLQHISDGLRQDLAQRQSGEVSVQVSQRALSDQGGQTDQQQRRQAEADGEARKPGRALSEDIEAQSLTFAQRLGGRSKE
nr:flagellar hook-length control protein FliK [uncultured Roseateles sp.]